MASNDKYICLDCRVGSKGIYPRCLRDGHRVKFFGKKITVPKKNNDRAWKRMERGEWLWDRRKVRRRISGFDYESVPGHKKGQLSRARRLIRTKNGPRVDLGG